MSHYTGDSGRPPGPSSSVGLRRSHDQRVIAGVCGGLARRLDVDPVLLRVLAVVLALFGGVGVVAYAVAWLVLPEDKPDSHSVLDNAFGAQRDNDRRNERPVALAVLLIIVITGFVLGGVVFGSRPGLIALLVVAAIVVLIMKDRGARTDRAPTGQPPGSTSPDPRPTADASVTRVTDLTARPTAPVGPWSTPPGTPYGPGAGTGSDSTGEWAPPATFDEPYSSVYAPPRTSPGGTPASTRPKSHLGVLTFSAAVLAMGLLGIIDAAGVAVSPVAYPFVALTVTALGLLMGTIYGRSRGLIAFGVVTALVFLPMAAIDTATNGTWVSWSSTHRVRETPTQIDEIEPTYSADAGQIVVDLRNIDFTGRTVTTSLDIGAGEVRVLVPPNVDVDATGTVGLGALNLFGQRHEGANLSSRVDDLGADGTGSGRLHLELSADIGQAEVVREAA